MNLSILCSTFPFFTEGVINLLQKRDIHMLNDFLKLDNRHIERITLLTFREINDIKKHITKSYSAVPLNGLKYYKNILSHSALIPTGIDKLDNLLGGGLFTGNIYEVCGPPCSGKNIFIHTILANILLENNVFFLDPKQDFSGKHIMKKLLNKYKDKERCLQLLKKILVKQISTKYDLITALFDIKKDLENGVTSRIIIIHYLPTLFLGTNDNTENNNIMNHFASILRYIAHQYHVVIIITNLITTWIDGDFRNTKGIVEKIACGKYWRSVPNIRLKLNKEKDNLYKICIVNNNTQNNLCYVMFNDDA